MAEDSTVLTLSEFQGFTCGPWWVDEDSAHDIDGEYAITVLGERGYQGDPTDSRIVADIRLVDETIAPTIGALENPKGEADARLIAAAPALLAACRRMRGLLEQARMATDSPLLLEDIREVLAEVQP